MTDGDLFKVGRKTARPPKDEKYPGETRRLIALYADLYLARFGEPPNIQPRFAAGLKRLVTTFGPEKVEERLRFFMAWDDPFVLQAGHTLAIFDSQWQKIAALVQRRQTDVYLMRMCSHNPRCQTAAQCSQETVRALRSGSRGTPSSFRGTPTPNDPF